jgi:hypothetical protein
LPTPFGNAVIFFYSPDYRNRETVKTALRISLSLVRSATAVSAALARQFLGNARMSVHFVSNSRQNVKKLYTFFENLHLLLLAYSPIRFCSIPNQLLTT